MIVRQLKLVVLGIAALSCWAETTFAQGSILAGPEVQVYPTGVLAGARIGLMTSEHSMWSLRLGYNHVRHRDLGEHDDERGGGFGFSLGYDRFLKGQDAGWFIGGKCDVWFNSIDWYDIQPDDSMIGGTTEITVVQPTAEAGYRFKLGDGGTHLSPTAAFGFEINVREDGAPVGEGPILLLGAMLLFGG